MTWYDWDVFTKNMPSEDLILAAHPDKIEFWDSNKKALRTSEEEVNSLIRELVADSESKTSVVLKGSAGHTPRRMPTKNKVYSFWWKKLILMGKFFYLGQILGEDLDTCWRCHEGGDRSLEMAHILPRVDGGSDDVSNLHMLCPRCHQNSEYLCGKEYWDWFTHERSLWMYLLRGNLSLLHKNDYLFLNRQSMDLFGVPVEEASKMYKKDPTQFDKYVTIDS